MRQLIANFKLLGHPMERYLVHNVNPELLSI